MATIKKNKSGKIPRPRSFSQKSKAAATRKHNLISGKTKPRKR